MADEDPQLDLPEVENEEEFPWAGILIIAVVVAGLAVLIWHGRHSGPQNDMEQQIALDKTHLDNERDKVFEMTRELDALKARIKTGQVEDKAKATAEYNKLAAEQRAQRETVKKLGDEYNAKVEQYHKQ